MGSVRFIDFWQILKKASSGFMHDRVLKLSASLAYYTVFSLGPMLIVIIFLTNIFFGREAIEGTIYGSIKQLVGDAAAIQIQDIIKSAAISDSGTLAAIIGVVTLIIGASSVFSEMQDSLNQIWGLKVRSTEGWTRTLISRLMSFSIVVSLGFLLLVSLVVNGLLEGFMDRLQTMFPEIAVVVIYIVNLLLTLFIVSFLFAIIFKVLPDAVISWRDVVWGSVFTGILFMIGKIGIAFYINKTNLGSSYGTSGSLVVLLVWVYYSSVILYFGAEFTKAYALRLGSEIRPRHYAVAVQIVTHEKEGNTIQQNENEKETIVKKTSPDRTTTERR